VNKLSKEALIIRCAYLFYQERMTIKEVADRLDISRFKVSRYLKEAEDNQYVEIKLNFPPGECETLALALENRFHINRVIIVPITPEMKSDMRRQAVGKKGMETLLEIGDGLSISVTWGRTIAYMVEALPYDIIHLNRITELTGGYGMITPERSASSLAPLLARKTQSACYQMHAPIIASNEVITENLLKDNSIRRTFEMAKSSDVAVFGAANLSGNSMLLRSGVLSEVELKQLRDRGVVGSIIGRFFNSDGVEVPTDFTKRSVSISWDDFMQIPQRIALIGGDDKVECIYSLLRGAVPTTLIIDDRAARQLIELVEGR
jgi:deoxyribonucleoside regulator